MNELLCTNGQEDGGSEDQGHAGVEDPRTDASAAAGTALPVAGFQRN